MDLRCRQISLNFSKLSCRKNTLAKWNNTIPIFGVLCMSLITPLFNRLMRFWIRPMTKVLPGLHCFSNPLSTQHKVSLWVRHIALSDLGLMAASIDYHLVMQILQEMMSPTLPSWIRRHLTHHRPHWLHRLSLPHPQGDCEEILLIFKLGLRVLDISQFFHV